MAKHLTKAKLFLLALAVGAAAFGVLQMPWAQVSATSITGYATELEITGAQAHPAAGILIGAFLAASCVFAISGKKLSIFSGAVMLLVSGFRIFSSISLLLNPAQQLINAVAAQTGVTGDAITPVLNINVYLALFSYLAMLLVSAISLWAAFKQAPKTTAQKYQRTDSTSLALREIDKDDPIDQWDALSRGEDPS